MDLKYLTVLTWSSIGNQSVSESGEQGNETSMRLTCSGVLVNNNQGFRVLLKGGKRPLSQKDVSLSNTYARRAVILAK